MDKVFEKTRELGQALLESEAGQRVKQPQAPVTHYADLAEIDARRKAIEDKYKN